MGVDRARGGERAAIGSRRGQSTALPSSRDGFGDYNFMSERERENCDFFTATERATYQKVSLQLHARASPIYFLDYLFAP
jgi:hypothetical protein